ncbi:TlpA family protein disulfide reductase [Ekhidna sp.]|uniref:TlpA family protein disulfide reductase n=1 Tax=Ekhidna sp. TaxID=2608089 RepID=UPI003B506B2F
MTLRILQIALILINLSALAQSSDTDRRNEDVLVRQTFELDPNRVYNYHTGKKIPAEKFISMVGQESFTIGRKIDSYGRIAKFLYDTTGAKFIVKREEKLKIGEDLPPFNIITENGEELLYDELLGNHLIIRFEMFADGYDFENDHLLSLQKEAEEFEEEVVGVIFFLGLNNELEPLETKGTKFHYLLNGGNFHDRYNVTTMPFTVIVDKNGKVVDVFRNNEIPNLSSLK